MKCTFDWKQVAPASPSVPRSFIYPVEAGMGFHHVKNAEALSTCSLNHCVDQLSSNMAPTVSTGNCCQQRDVKIAIYGQRGGANWPRDFSTEAVGKADGGILRENKTL